MARRKHCFTSLALKFEFFNTFPSETAQVYRVRRCFLMNETSSTFGQCTRRNFLQSGLAAAALPAMSAASVFANPAKPGKAPESQRLFLFLDWYHVQKGELKVTLDRQRISAEGKKTLEMYATEFGKKFDQSRHGFNSDAPFGIRIVQERAERSKPWLVADQPWEESVSSPTVLFDEGRFRCWYSATLKGESADDDGRPRARDGAIWQCASVRGKLGRPELVEARPKDSFQPRFSRQ